MRPANIDELEMVTGASEYHGSAHSEQGRTDRHVVSLLVGR